MSGETLRGPVKVSLAKKPPGRPLDVSATGLAFGNYSPGAASATQANSTIKVYCATSWYLLPSFAIALSAGGAGVW
ncbi:MAG TPA: hypothetical protein VIY09_05580 [Rhizomicrobium sp.]